MAIRRSGNEPLTLTWEPWLGAGLVLLGGGVILAGWAGQLLDAAGLGWQPARLLLLVLAELGWLAAWIVAVVWLWRRFAPDRGVGMAKRYEIAGLLSREALWRNRWLARPDLYAKPDREPVWRIRARA